MKKVLSFVLSAILCIGVVASLSFGFTGCGKDENTLVVGYTIYAPMNYCDDNGEFVGHDTELAELVCEKLGYEVKFVEIQWDYKVMELESNNIDLIWNGMTITDELKESILISDPYMINQQVIVTKSNNASKYNTKEDLVNASSVVYEGGSAAEIVITDLNLPSSVKLVNATSQASALLEVAAGTSEVAVIDITMAKSMTGEGTDYSNLTYKNVGFPEEQYGIGMRKEDTELCEKINEVLAEFEEDGTLDELYNKYCS